MKHSKVILLIAFTSVLFLCGCNKSEPSLSTLFKDYAAARDIKKEKYEDALGKYYNILEEDGDRAGTHSNIGVLLNLVQKPEDALKSLQHALKIAEEKGNPEELFSVRYNLGVHYGALKKVSEALENYQVALDIMPTSNEIKTNIELLMQQQQDQKNQQKDGDQKSDPSQGGGQGESKDKNDEGDNDKDKSQKEKNPDKQGSPKYQPRPFKGDQLSEGDVKKILSELRNQEQKIRANFDKKEKGKTKNNEKDW